MAFVRRTPAAPPPGDPEELYRRLAEANRGPEALWGHQVDVLREWHSNHRDRRDVAIELPTGAGKTLVGGLIADWRRRVHGDRAAYLCPTRQLARQTKDALDDYGIPNVLLTGRVRTWSPSDRTRYTAGKALAVSVYTHVFNSSPALDDAQLLLLDDAHAAEQSVAAPWSLSIDRSSSAYLDVLSVLSDAFDPLVISRLRTSSPDRQYLSTVYLASPSGVAARAGQLQDVLDAASAAGALSGPARYGLGTIAGHVDRCMVYASYRAVLLRPLVSPTSFHPAFENPGRRVYMSATLGAGGELERAFGRRQIARIPIPRGWENQATGRRFFCFPQITVDLARAPEGLPAWTQSVIKEHGRVAVLAPDGRTADSFVAKYVPDGYTILGGSDVEEDLTAFTGNPAAALVLSNRYDGIDLPNDDCRLVVLVGLPARGDLQERFLHGSLGALEVLQERIRARIVQGAGRASRNSRDYSAVLVLGTDLTSYLTRDDVQGALHPEIHAELTFGLENSLQVASGEVAENLRTFAEHGPAWREVEVDIVADRDNFTRKDPVGAAQLHAAAGLEVAAWEAVWQGDWPRALEQARQVLDALRGGRVPQRYAALWNYLAAGWALRVGAQSGDDKLLEVSQRYYRDAQASARGTTWLSHLSAPTDREDHDNEHAVDKVDLAASEAILDDLVRLGRPVNFEPTVAETRSGLLATEATPYEKALVVLGRFAGARDSVGNGNASAAPDATWVFSSELWVLWEAKSDAKPEGELGPNDVRQAGSHVRYAEQTRGVAAPSGSLSLLVTPQSTVHPAARSVAEPHVYLVRPAEVLELLDALVRAWRAIRSRGAAAVGVDGVLDALRTEGALPSQWLPRLQHLPVAAATPDDALEPSPPSR